MSIKTGAEERMIKVKEKIESKSKWKRTRERKGGNKELQCDERGDKANKKKRRTKKDMQIKGK